MNANSRKPCGAPHTLEVYFPSFPQIDIVKLAQSVREAEPDEPDSCRIALIDDRMVADTRLLTYNATLGELSMPIIIQGVRSPDFEKTTCRLSSPVREQLAGHEAFALLVTAGGESYKPVEHWIFLYKVAIGLCEQGALGVGNQPIRSAFPAAFMIDLPTLPANETSEENLTLWNLMREEGQPRQMLVEFARAAAGGREWFITRGFAQCGFPDFVFELAGKDELPEVAELFEELFHYLFQSGPVIQPGHTTGDDEKAYRFIEAPDIDWPFENFGLLQVQREERTKKKRFGLF